MTTHTDSPEPAPHGSTGPLPFDVWALGTVVVFILLVVARVLVAA